MPPAQVFDSPAHADRQAGAAGASGAEGRREGLPIEEWYASEDRPKPLRDRWAKLGRLRELGVEPYAYAFDPTHDLARAVQAWPGEGDFARCLRRGCPRR